MKLTEVIKTGFFSAPSPAETPLNMILEALCSVREADFIASAVGDNFVFDDPDLHARRSR